MNKLEAEYIWGFMLPLGSESFLPIGI